MPCLVWLYLNVLLVASWLAGGAAPALFSSQLPRVHSHSPWVLAHSLTLTLTLTLPPPFNASHHLPACLTSYNTVLVPRLPSPYSLRTPLLVHVLPFPVHYRVLSLSPLSPPHPQPPACKSRHCTFLSSLPYLLPLHPLNFVSTRFAFLPSWTGFLTPQRTI